MRNFEKKKQHCFEQKLSIFDFIDNPNISRGVFYFKEFSFNQNFHQRSDSTNVDFGIVVENTDIPIFE